MTELEQSTEFYNSGLWELIKIVILPGVFFLAGLSFKEILEYFKERKRLKNLRVYLKSQFEVLILLAEEQSKYLNSTTNTLENIDIKYYPITKVVGINYERFKAVNLIDFYNIFSKRNKKSKILATRKFNEAQAAIDYIYTVVNSIDKHNESFSDELTKLSHIWNDSQARLKETVNLMVKKAIENQVQLSEDSYVFEISNILKQTGDNLSENKHINYNLVYENVILKMDDFLKNNRDSRNSLLVKDLTYWKIAYRNIVQLFEDRIDLYTDISNELIRQVSTIKKVTINL